MFKNNIVELRPWQDYIVGYLLSSLDHCNCLYNADRVGRGKGKSTMIRAIGLDLLSQGRKVYINSPCETVWYYADEFINLDLDKLKDKINDGDVILLDETKYSEVKKIIEFCHSRNVTLLGFVNYER